MTSRRKPAAPASEPRRRSKGAKVYSARILPKVRMLLELGVDEHGLAAYLGIEVETFLQWAAANAPLRDALDSREEYRRWDRERNLQMARELASRGASDADIATAFNVSPRTLARWRRKFPEFDEALTMGEALQLQVAERTLFQMATGFTYEEEKTVSTKAGLFKIREQRTCLPSEGMLRLYLAANKPEKYSAKPKPGAVDDDSDEITKLMKGGAGSVLIANKDAG